MGCCKSALFGSNKAEITGLSARAQAKPFHEEGVHNDEAR
jgi:hypothetical protein